MILVFVILSFVSGAAPALASAFPERTPVTVSDSLYRAHHPRLLFTQRELPALKQKVRDGGHDDTAYDYIRFIVESVYYPVEADSLLFEDTFGINVIPNLGIAAYLETPADRSAYDFGRRITLYIATDFEPDDNVFYSPLRMRALAFGYDMFFDDCTDSLRTYVRNEIIAYIDTTLSVLHYQRWLHSPYVSNISAVIGSALGLSAVCLEHEMTRDRVEAAMTRADDYVTAWHEALLDPDGAYHEGAMYAGWSMRNLAYYFWAAKRRNDGYGDRAPPVKIRNMEKWIAFATLPTGGAAVNNVNDAAYLNYPLARHHTYFDWAQTEWDSGLSAWLWDRLVGPTYGHESGILSDKAATVLWHKNQTPQNPANALPNHMLWKQRGLYYSRTGWPETDTSDDLVFSFYSGKFQGGHAHEDQNNLTLYGYGGAFAVDNGFGAVAKQSEAHNMVFIDGRGQHNAGGSIGTDGTISEHILSGFADYLLGDATAAYNTYSEFNMPGTPFEDDDWSYGYDGGNPVNYAFRTIIGVHDGTTPPYFVVADDIDKDGATHLYVWRMHTHEDNVIDVTANPIQIHGGDGVLDLYVVNPPPESLNVAEEPFDNENVDPNTVILSVSSVAVDPHFVFLLLPHHLSTSPPTVARNEFPWGETIQLHHAAGVTDILVFNLSGVPVTAAFPGGPGEQEVLLVTDARITVLRISGSRIENYLAVNVSDLTWAGIPYIRVADGPLNCALFNNRIDIDRPGAEFIFYGQDAKEVYCREKPIGVLNDGGYLVPDPSGHHDLSDPMTIRSYPNPFNSAVSVVVHIKDEEPVTVRIFDVNGRLVKTLWNGPLPSGANLLRWNGINNKGESVATGIYFVKAHAGSIHDTAKITLLK